MTDETPQELWDDRYRQADHRWSGNVNVALADVGRSLTPGTALDLGSGEGADVIWLAEHGWQPTGVDISAVAVSRADQAARARGLAGDRARFLVADLAQWDNEQTYDLVVSSFVHSQGDYERAGILRACSQYVADGGYLLVISHATFPPWAGAHRDADAKDHHHDETTPESELELLQLDPLEWVVEIAELRSREATGPDGQVATLHDTVVLARKITTRP